MNQTNFDVGNGQVIISTSTVPSVQYKSNLGFDGFGGVSVWDWILAQGILEMLGTLWLWLSILAYIVSIILLVLYVFAATRRNLYAKLLTQELRDAEKLYDELYRGASSSNRMQDVLVHSSSSNPTDWRLAVIEADIILDEALKERGYKGVSLGERLKSISPSQLESLNDAWEAHKIRNKIAHAGSDFILTKRIAQETIVKYQRVFKELGVI